MGTLIWACTKGRDECHRPASRGKTLEQRKKKIGGYTEGHGEGNREPQRLGIRG